MTERVSKAILLLGKKRILAKIQEAKYDYLDPDWQEEFASFEEAYEEWGDCVAERQIAQDIAIATLGYTASKEDILLFMEEFAEQMNIDIG